MGKNMINVKNKKVCFPLHDPQKLYRARGIFYFILIFFLNH